MLKDLLGAPIRTLAFVASILLFALSAVGEVNAGTIQFGIDAPVARWLVGAVSFGLALSILFLPSPTEGTSSAREPKPSHPPSGLPRGLYAWDRHPQLEFSHLLETGTRLSISARTAVNIVSRNASEIRRFLERGGQLRVAVLDPERAELLDIYTEPAGRLTDNLATGLRFLEDLSSLFPNRVQVRLTHRAPTYGLIWVDCLETGGQVIANSPSVLQVKIYLEHSRTGAGRPNFLLTPNDDPWHQVFVDDFNSIWAAATPNGSKPVAHERKRPRGR